MRKASCLACRKRHLKCNNESPCAGCVKSNTTCVYAEPQRRGRRKGTTRTVLENQIDFLERSLKDEKRRQSNFKRQLGYYKAISKSGSDSSSSRHKRRADCLESNSVLATVDSYLGRASEVVMCINAFKGFVGSELPILHMPVNLEEFHRNESTPSTFLVYTMLALQQHYCGNTKRAKDLATHAQLMQKVMKKPSLMTAAGLVILASYLIGACESLQGLDLVELADDMLQLKGAADKCKYGRTRTGGLPEGINVLRLRVTLHKHTKPTEQFMLDRLFARQQLQARLVVLRRDIDYGVNLHLLKKVYEALLDTEVSMWIQTKDEVHEDKCLEYINEIQCLVDGMPESPVSQFVSYAVCARVLGMLNHTEEALKVAEKGKSIIPFFLNAKGFFPSIGFCATDIWAILYHGGQKRSAKVVSSFIEPLCIPYPFVGRVFSYAKKNGSRIRHRAFETEILSSMTPFLQYASFGEIADQILN